MIAVTIVQTYERVVASMMDAVEISENGASTDMS